jgi:tRNA1Val (adenine37-N6)-methyltransferase
MGGTAGGNARERFPRGLSQPSGGFRFSLDALLLAAFAGRERVRGRVLDLGAGCGVVGLGLALDHPDFFGVGLDADAAVLVHARENARRLGLDGRFAFLVGDAGRPGCLQAESMDLVLCNPPYRDPSSGRVCPDESRATARFETGAGLRDFARAASRALRNRRPCAFIHLAERVDDLLLALREAQLRPKEILFVHQRADGPARLVLVRALKNGGPGLTVLPPLVLHEGEGASTRLTPGALALCPRLACNAGPAESAAAG